jgi:hypothetical protein
LETRGVRIVEKVPFSSKGDFFSHLKGTIMERESVRISFAVRSPLSVVPFMEQPNAADIEEELSAGYVQRR